MRGQLRVVLWASLLFSYLGGCTADEHQLIVNVRTDLTPGADFDQVTVELFDERGTFGERLRMVELRAIEGDDYAAGYRVAELEALPSGAYVLRAALLLDGALVVDALGPIELRANRAVTIDASNSCVGVVCPDPAAPNATVCVAGSCAEPECLFQPDRPGCPAPPDAGADTGTPSDGSMDAGLDGDAAGDASTDAGADADADGDADAGPPPSPPGYVYVPAGPFHMGCNPAVDTICEDDEQPRHEVTLDAFHIMRREVSMSEWGMCIGSRDCGVPDDGSNWTPFATPNDPVVDITQGEASAYCRWAGGRLPTEAEWEKAARGTDERVYPWGNAPPSCALANYFECGDVRRSVDVHDDVASPYGTINMAGNVWEWVSDYYSADYYASSATVNPTGPPTGDTIVIRGGSHDWEAPALRATKRLGYERPTHVIGVRCARDVD